MIAARASRFRNPVFLLALAAALLAFVVQSGELGTSDTTHRLESAHSFWTSDPPVSLYEYPEFGVHGRNGSIQSWFGIGQSILMLPFDLLGTAVEKVPIFTQYADTDPSVRDIVVVYLTQILITILTALASLKLLREFGFSSNHSIIGVLAFLVATTHLHYTQNMQENNYICLLTLSGFAFELEWTRTGRRRALLIGSGAFGLNLLTRITTGMDLMAGILFVLLVLRFDSNRRDRLRTYAITAIPVFCFFGFLDRSYQFHRGGAGAAAGAGRGAGGAGARGPGRPRT